MFHIVPPACGPEAVEGDSTSGGRMEITFHIQMRTKAESAGVVDSSPIRSQSVPDSER
jgi:hypothetical protein